MYFWPNLYKTTRVVYWGLSTSAFSQEPTIGSPVTPATTHREVEQKDEKHGIFRTVAGGCEAGQSKEMFQ